MTFKAACETIERADILRMPDGSAPTAEQIFAYSPRGELAMISIWYAEACDVLKARDHAKT